MSLGFNIPTTTDLDNLGGFPKVPNGNYHVKVVEVEEDQNRGKLIVTLEVLAGTVDDCEALRHKEFFSINEKNMNVRRLIALLVASGMATLDQIKKAQEAGEPVEPDWTKLVDRTFCCEVATDTSEDGKEWTKIPFDNIWHVDARSARSIPKDKGAIAAAASGDAAFAAETKTLAAEPDLEESPF